MRAPQAEDLGEEVPFLLAKRAYQSLTFLKFYAKADRH